MELVANWLLANTLVGDACLVAASACTDCTYLSMRSCSCCCKAVTTTPRSARAPSCQSSSFGSHNFLLARSKIEVAWSTTDYVSKDMGKFEHTHPAWIDPEVTCSHLMKILPVGGVPRAIWAIWASCADHEGRQGCDETHWDHCQEAWHDQPVGSVRVSTHGLRAAGRLPMVPREWWCR